MFALMCLPAMAGTTSVYTDVSKCHVADTEWDMFRHACKGPGGRTVELHYVEGVASILVDGDAESPAAKVRIPVGGEGKVFGPRVEWRVRDGRPCAVIARVSTDRGSRLVVASLAKPAQVFGLERNNKDAQKASERACDSVGKPYAPEGEIPVEVRGDWTLSGRCDDPNKVTIGAKSFTVTFPGKTFSYDRVEKNRIYLHGANYGGKEYTLMGYNAAGDTYEAGVVVNADEQEGRIKVIPVSYDVGNQFSPIDDKPFQPCK